MCDGRLFSGLAGPLSAALPIHHAPINGHDNIPALAAAILDHAPPRFALAGLSMGGIVAMEVVNQAPGRVDRIALMDTNPLTEKEAVKARRDRQMEKVQGGGLRQVMAEEMKPLYLAAGEKRDQILELCMDMALRQGNDVFIRQSKALQRRADYREVLTKIRVPALVLCGREDRLCPLERHELMHELIPGSTLQIVEEAGHLPVLEQPERVTRALFDWLDR